MTRLEFGIRNSELRHTLGRSVTVLKRRALQVSHQRSHLSGPVYPHRHCHPKHLKVVLRQTGAVHQPVTVSQQPLAVTPDKSVDHRETVRQVIGLKREEVRGPMLAMTVRPKADSLNRNM